MRGDYPDDTFTENDVLRQLDAAGLVTATGAVTYFLNVRLTTTRTLVFRFTKTIGLLIATLDVEDSTSQKRSQISGTLRYG
jgi:hypothetical protein